MPNLIISQKKKGSRAEVRDRVDPKEVPPGRRNAPCQRTCRPTSVRRIARARSPARLSPRRPHAFAQFLVVLAVLLRCLFFRAYRSEMSFIEFYSSDGAPNNLLLTQHSMDFSSFAMFIEMKRFCCRKLRGHNQCRPQPMPPPTKNTMPPAHLPAGHGPGSPTAKHEVLKLHVPMVDTGHLCPSARFRG